MPQNLPSLNPPDFVDGEPPQELEKNCPMSARTATVLAVSAIVALLYLLISEDSAGSSIGKYPVISLLLLSATYSDSEESFLTFEALTLMTFLMRLLLR